MAMAEKGQMLGSEWKILIGISFRENVVVLIGDGAMNELCVSIDIERPYRETCQILTIGIRQNAPGPIDRAPGMRIELRCFIQTGGYAIMISANRNRIQTAYDVDSFDR